MQKKCRNWEGSGTRETFVGLLRYFRRLEPLAVMAPDDLFVGFFVVGVFVSLAVPTKFLAGVARGLDGEEGGLGGEVPALFVAATVTV